MLRHPLALLLAVALALAAAGLIYDSVSGPSGESSHNASAGVKRATPDTVTATLAKKCKKRKGQRKKCRKRKAPVVPLPAPPSPAGNPPAPSTQIERVVLSWGCDITPIEDRANVDLDLQVWNSDGSHAGWLAAGNVMENEIPNAMHLGDSSGNWTPVCETSAPIPHEEFVDNDGNSHLVTVGVCYYAYRGTNAPQVDFNLRFDYTNGTTGSTGPNTLFTTPGQAITFVSSKPGEYLPTDVCGGT